MADGAPAFGPFALGLAEQERRARLRELRALAFLLLGGTHPLVDRLAEAEEDADAQAEAAVLLGQLPGRPMRRLLCTYAWLLRRRASA